MEKSIISRLCCPVCNFSHTRQIFKRNFNETLIQQYMSVAYQGNADISFLIENDISFEIVKCSKCGISYQKYVLNDEGLNELYNKWIDPKLAEKWNQKEKGIKNGSYESILNTVKSYFSREPDSIKVLDYGAGFGDFLIYAKQQGFKTYAYEYSDERINYLKNKGIDVITSGDNQLFDFIIINQVLEHVTNPHDILSEITSKIKKDGLLFVSVPNCKGITTKLKTIDSINDPDEIHEKLLKASVAAFQHINFFTNQGLKKMCKSHQIKPINPFNQIFIKPITIKSFIRPFNRNFFQTSIFFKKTTI